VILVPKAAWEAGPEGDSEKQRGTKSDKEKQKQHLRRKR